MSLNDTFVFFVLFCSERFDYASFGNIRLHGGTDAEVGEAWVQQHVQGFADGWVRHERMLNCIYEL